LVWQSQTPGAKSAYWDGTNNSGDDIPTGMYFYRLQTSTKSLTKKMTLIR
jgi:flagellar hook assembly protein FlgD